MIRVIIADDHAIVRRGLIEILTGAPDAVEVGEASNACELLSLVRRGRWDAAVLDITMSGRNGLDALKELKQINLLLPVLVLSMHPEEQFAVRALKAGASGYMNKEVAPEELVAALYKICKGGRYVSPALAEKLAVELGGKICPPNEEGLSDREYQVMLMIASGRQVSEIAKELVLSVKTVSTYRARVLDKMKMRTNAELTHYAIKHRLVDLS